jgi:hypothetical protein
MFCVEGVQDQIYRCAGYPSMAKGLTTETQIPFHVENRKKNQFQANKLFIQYINFPVHTVRRPTVLK